MNNFYCQNKSGISSPNESSTLFANLKKPRLLIKISSTNQKNNSNTRTSSEIVPVKSVISLTTSITPLKSNSPQPSGPEEKKLSEKALLTGESFAQTNQSSSLVGKNSLTSLNSLQPSPLGVRRMPEKKAPLKGGSFGKSNRGSLRVVKKRVLSLSQILSKLRFQRKKKVELLKRRRPIKPIIPPKSLIIILKEKPENGIYNRRIIDYKHCGLLQRYIGLGGKILARRQTRLTAKQQRYVAKTIKSARIMGLLPFVSRERGFFR